MAPGAVGVIDHRGLALSGQLLSNVGKARVTIALFPFACVVQNVSAHLVPLLTLSTSSRTASSSRCCPATFGVRLSSTSPSIVSVMIGT